METFIVCIRLKFGTLSLISFYGLGVSRTTSMLAASAIGWVVLLSGVEATSRGVQTTCDGTHFIVFLEGFSTSQPLCLYFSTLQPTATENFGCSSWTGGERLKCDDPEKGHMPWASKPVST